MFIGGGNSSVGDLISNVERGIYVSTFNYCRVLDPKSLVVTGLTRNGTFMIENGRITGAVTNMRFTQSFVNALGPGKVLDIADDARFADSEFGPLFVHAPSMRLAAWNFTGGADG
jgi:predicted Zn-dependent protease